MKGHEFNRDENNPYYMWECKKCGLRWGFGKTMCGNLLRRDWWTYNPLNPSEDDEKLMRTCEEEIMRKALC